MATDVSALGLPVDSSDAVKATGDLRALADAAKQAEGAAGRLANESRKAGQAAREAAAAEGQRAASIKQAAADYERLRASVDSVYGASKKYESALNTMNRAMSSGAIGSGEEYARVLGLVENKLLGISNTSRAAFDKLARSVDPATEAAHRYQQQLQVVAQATRDGVITDGERANMLRMLEDQFAATTRELNGEAAAARAAAQEKIAADRQAAAEAKRAAAERIAAERDAARAAQQAAREQAAAARESAREAQTAARQKAAAEQEAAREAQRAARAYEQTRAAVDPLFAASKRYESALRDLDEALARNIISQRQHQQLSDSAAQQYLVMGTAADQASRSFNAGAYGITNLSYQVQDFIVQVTSGTDVLRALAQQAPQALGAMGFAGPLALWGSIAGTVVAGAAAVYMAFRDVEDQSKKSNTAQDRYNESLQNYVTNAGAASDAANRFAGSIGVRSLAQAFKEYDAVIDAFVKTTEGTYTWWERSRDMLAGRNQGIGDTTNMVTDQLKTMADTLKLPEGEAAGLVLAMKALTETEPTALSEIVDKTTALDALLRETYGSPRLAPPEVQQFWQDILNMGAAAGDEMSAVMDNLGKDLEKVNREIKDSIQAQRDQNAAAAAAVADYAAQEAMTRAIYEHGEKSAEVEALKREAAMAVAQAFIEQNDLAGENAALVEAAAASAYDAEAATNGWASAMAAVNAQLQGAFALIASLGGGMISSAGVRAANAVLDAGGTAADAAKAQRRREQELKLYNEQDQAIARGESSPAIYDMMRAEQERQWAEEDKLLDRMTAAREAEAEARKAGRKKGGGKGKTSPTERATKAYDDSIRKEIESMKAEAALLDSLIPSYDEYGNAVAAAKKEAEMLQQLKNKDVEITPALREQVAGLAQEYYRVSNAVEAARERHEQFRSSLEEARSAQESAFSGLIRGAHDFGEALAGVLDKLAEMAASAAFDTLWGGNLSKWTGNILSSIGIGAPVANAKGGVYDSASLSAFSGQVVNKPTLFAFAKGAGLMGEAGPEAIMPLSRGADGRLGVRATRDDRGNEQSNDMAVTLIVRAEEGDMFVPRVEAVAEGVTVRVVDGAIQTVDKQLPDKIEEHLSDRRAR